MDIAPQSKLPAVRSIDWTMFTGLKSVAITAGASAPEILVEQILDGFAERFQIAVETLTTSSFWSGT